MREMNDGKYKKGQLAKTITGSGGASILPPEDLDKKIKNGLSVAGVVHPEQVPVIPEAEDFAAPGLIPAGAYKNREFREQMITFANIVPRTLRDLLFDPQTSGGLLISVREGQCNQLVSALKDGGIADASRIDEVVDSQKEIISVV